MPHLNFKNVDIETVKELSVSKTKELAEAFGCPESDITYDVIHNTSIINGEIIEGDKTVIINMFERSQDIKDAVVHILEDYLKEITVIFQISTPYNYYEHGKKFK